MTTPIPYYPYYMPPTQSTQSGGSPRGVTINIYNPTATNGGGSVPATFNQANQTNIQNMPQSQQSATTPPITLPQKPLATTSLDKSKNTGSEKKQTEIVPLTDDYLKTLENYLNNENAEVRMMGAKELVKRFDEDRNRKSDPALNALLNKTLQDSSQVNRVLALGILDAGCATGDEETVEILKQMQQSDSGYNQDALVASQVLLKMAGQKINVSTEDVQEPPKEDEQKTTGQKLDLKEV